MVSPAFADAYAHRPPAHAERARRPAPAIGRAGPARRGRSALAASLPRTGMTATAHPTPRPAGSLRSCLRRVTPTLIAAAVRRRLRDRLAAQPGSCGAPVPAAAVPGRGFGLWNNWWYGGHDVLGYSVLFPAGGRAAHPAIAGAVAATASAGAVRAAGSPAFRRARRGSAPWCSAPPPQLNLFTGRLAFAFGRAAGARRPWWRWTRGRKGLARASALLSALCSPVAALFAALAAAGMRSAAISRVGAVAAALPGAAVVIAALRAGGAAGDRIPGGRYEPFGLATMAPVLVVAR